MNVLIAEVHCLLVDSKLEGHLLINNFYSNQALLLLNLSPVKSFVKETFLVLLWLLWIFLGGNRGIERKSLLVSGCEIKLGHFSRGWWFLDGVICYKIVNWCHSILISKGGCCLEAFCLSNFMRKVSIFRLLLNSLLNRLKFYWWFLLLDFIFIFVIRALFLCTK